MVDKETFTLVQFQNVCHIIVGQIEVKDIKILLPYALDGPSLE